MSRLSSTTPAITCLKWHCEQYYSFFIPNDWYRLQRADGREGTLYAPDPADLTTFFAVELRNLDTSVTPRTPDHLIENLVKAIGQLADSTLESCSSNITGDSIELEVKYLFREQGNTRKRWVRMFYQGRYQIIMTAQGTTLEKYRYWQPWFYEAMMTATLHDSRTQPEVKALSGKPV